MSLPVPLAVRVGDQHITGEVQSLAFRREAVGGVRSITFNLARSLTDLSGLEPLAKVYIYDTRTAATVAEGRFSDPGRGADSSGQRWDCVAFGPAQAASDITQPKIYIDRGVSDGWQPVEPTHPFPSVGSSQRPDAGSMAPQGILAQFSSGGDGVVSNSRGVYRYNRIWQAGGRLAFVGANKLSGINDALWLVQIITGIDGGFSTTAATAAASTTLGTQSATVGTNFTIGDNTTAFRFVWVGAPNLLGDNTWTFWQDVCIEAIRKNKSGGDITVGYYGAATPNAIIEDLLGSGFLPEFDGPNAIATPTATQIGQLAYPGGVTAAKILDDLMAVEPSYRWYTTPSGASGKYGFSWAPWPTTVRYEATLDDGGSFPLSTQGLYNRVVVMWVDESGAQRSTWVSAACPILDKNGVIRQESIDLGSELGSAAQASSAGATFLAQNNVPKNAGTLTVARPIRDVIRGCDVQPWEIEAGELVRVRGVEAYPDAFNTSTNDGVGVFRIFAVDYTSEGNSASLSLDSDPHTTEDALVALMNDRKRGLPGKPGSGW